MYKIFFTGMILASFVGISQDDWMSFPVKKDSVTRTKTALDYSQRDGEVTIKKDERIDRLDAFVRQGEESIAGVLIDGYRVMIFFDQSKTVAEQQKARFLSAYSSHKAYIDYLAPNYRVRVGNFRTKLEAEKLKHELIASFPTAIVVEDKIQLPTLPQALPE